MEQISQAVVEGEEIARRAWETVSGTALGDELVATVADPLRYRRGRRQVQALMKMQKAIDEAGLTGQVVPDRTLFPLLEFVAREEDESMIDRWACLLARAAVGEVSTPGMYIEALATLDPAEAVWIDRLQKAGNHQPPSLIPIWIDAQDAEQLLTTALRLERLSRNGLLAPETEDSAGCRLAAMDSEIGMLIGQRTLTPRVSGGD